MLSNPMLQRRVTRKTGNRLRRNEYFHNPDSSLIRLIETRLYNPIFGVSPVLQRRVGKSANDSQG